MKILIVSASIAFVAVIAAAAFLYADGGAVSSAPNTDYGFYTFERQSEYNGTVLEFYESGDESFRYYHDENGYVLLRDTETGAVNYAVSDGGSPVDSGVSVGANAADIAAVPKMTAYDFSETYIADNSQEVYSRTVLNTAASEIANIVIIIEFADQTVTPGDELDIFNDSEYSLQNYFAEQSDGTINIESYFPTLGGNVYVYKDRNPRSHYNIKDASGYNRQNLETELLKGAIDKVKEYLTFPSDIDLDTDGDGYIDSVSFLIGGDSGNDWGGLLWPHSWNLDAIDGSGYSEIGGVKVGDYSFNFLSGLNLGLLAHETAHVFGAPDLYHSVKDFAPVGDWCLMQAQDDVPQYMLTYLRENYIGGLSEERIGDITASGTYTLIPADSEEGRIAYRIYTDDPDEYFMLEYRRKNISGYDSEIPGSGLIVYRVREPDDFSDSKGNIDAVYRGTGSKADEVFVFRPKISVVGNESGGEVLYNRSLSDLQYAWLSPENRYFSSVGDAASTQKYDPDALYYSDGDNSGVVIKATAVSDENITFEVSVPGDNLSDSYFRDKFSVDSSAFVNSTDYSGLSVVIGTGNPEPDYIGAIKISAMSGGSEAASVNISNAEFRAAFESGQRRFEAAFVVNGKGKTPSGVYYTDLPTAKEPDTVKVSVIYNGRTIQIASVAIDDSAVNWKTVVNTASQKAAGIFASGDMTLGIGADGTVDVSGTGTSGKRGAEGFENAVTAAVGYSHALVVDETMKVYSFGTDYYGEGKVSGWTDVIAVAAGYYVTYALHADGSVSGTGLNSYLVSGWTSVESIAAGLRHVVAVKTDGTLLWGGNNSYGQLTGLNEIKNAVAVTAGDDFTAILLSDGTVTVKGGNGFDAVSSWSNVEKIAAGSRHLLALTADGKLLSAGDNGYGQCETAGLEDITDIAAGDTHSAFLRTDGTVLFRGFGDGAVTGIGNLIYPDYESVTEVSVSAETVYLTAGSSETVTFTVSPETATYKKISYTASDENVFSYTVSDGMITITGSAEGTATLTLSAEGGDAEAVITVTVLTAATGITFGSETLKLFVGDSYVPVASVTPEGGYHSGETVYALTEGAEAVSFENGIVYAYAAGNAVIEATLGEFTAVLNITVVEEESVRELAVLEGGVVPTTSVYYYGDEFDPSRYTLKVTLENGEVSTYPLESVNASVTGYDRFATEEIEVSVAYSGAVCKLSVTVNDYVVSVEPTSETTAAVAAYVQLYNYDLPGDEGGSFSYIAVYASGKTETRLFALSALRGYDKTVTGPQTLTYIRNEFTHPDLEKPSFSLTLNVYDWAESISYTPSKQQFAFGEGLPESDIADVYMATGGVRHFELERLTVTDESAAGLEVSPPYSSFNSLVAGTHRIIVSYTDPALSAKGAENAVVSCIVNFEVEVAPEYSFGGTFFYDGGVQRFVYPVGGKYDFVTVSEQEGALFTASEVQNVDQILGSSGGMFCFVNGFDGSKEGRTNAYIDIAYVSQSYSADSGYTRSVMYVVQDRQIALYGYSESARISLTPLKPEYSFDETVTAHFVLSDGGETLIFPDFVPEYDAAVGEVRISGEFLGTTYFSSVYVPDQTELEPVADVTVEYGDPVAFEVWAVSLITGERRLLSEGEYTAEGDLGSFVVGSRTITLTYEGFSTSFTLTVVDPIDEVAVLTPPKTTYIDGDIFDPDSEYVLTWRSGKKLTVRYGAENFYVDPDPEGYVFGGSNFGRGFTIYYRADYGGDIAVWSGETRLITRPRSISVTVKDEYVFTGEAPALEVKALFTDGGSVTLGRGDYTVEFDSSVPGYVTGSVSYVYDEDEAALTAQFTVRVIRKPQSVTVTPPSKTDYGYGEAIDWAGASVRVVYEDGNIQIVSANDIKGFFGIDYEPRTSGRATVRISLGGVTAAFTVNYGEKGAAVDCEDTDFAAVDLTKETIVLFSPGKADTARAVINSVAGYLTPSYCRADGTVLYDYTLPAMTGDEYRLSNADGTAVIVFKIFVRGDTDGDGLITQNDVFGMADALVGKGGEAEFDFDGDGISWLSDLINYQRRTASEPQPSPVRTAAENFVAPVSGFGRKKYV